jgi:hypothetical protein
MIDDTPESGNALADKPQENAAVTGSSALPQDNLTSSPTISLRA